MCFSKGYGYNRVTMKKLLLFLFGLCFFLFSQQANAASQFSTSANTTYTISDTGNTHVVASIVLQNTTQNYFATSYTLKVGFPTISNLAASDPNGSIVPIITKTKDGQDIQLHFNTVVYGNGSKLPFTISFDTPDVANRQGTIWEVNIPGLSDGSDFSTFQVSIVPPVDFGTPTYIKPMQSNNSLTFTKEQLGNAGISLAFGDTESYQYALSYHLANTNLFPMTTDIALPPTTNYQTVELDSLSPKPQNVKIDADGNWLATYLLTPGQKTTVRATGVINLSLTPKKEELSSSDRQQYLSAQPYWDVTDFAIQQQAKKLKTPEAIFNYVVNHLTYDYSRVTETQIRLGARKVLHDGTSAVCLEFTDLFVTLARAAGIPAREVDGFAYTKNETQRPLSLGKDILHAWPEYYDDSLGEWIMVDPTWENTTGGVDYFHTFDFDHVAFVIKGNKSDYPIPAGGYKLPGQENLKDVDIAFSDKVITDSPTITTAFHLPPTALSGFPISGDIMIQNTGYVLLPPQRATVYSRVLQPFSSQLTLPALPPFGHEDVQVSFKKVPFLTNTADTVTIAIDGKTIAQKITILAFSAKQLLIGGLIVAILGLIIFVVATKARRI